MLSLEKCVEILNSSSTKKYTVDEAKLIRDFLTRIAKKQVKQNLQKKSA
jgi:hypothetical protein